MHYVLLILCTVSLFAMSQKPLSKQIDDWEYNATTQDTLTKSTQAMLPTRTLSAPAPMMEAATVGLAVGGAKDADNFYENIDHGFLPKMSSITYEGLFYDHYFHLPPPPTCDALFCPSFESVERTNPFSNEKEYFLGVGLNSNLDASKFKRKALNLVVVFDISGSMGSRFDRYYYDGSLSKKDNETSVETKMQIATASLVKMIDHLSGDDRLGIVLFDNHAYPAKPLRLIKETLIEKTKTHILALQDRGGTNWSAGYKAGVKLFDTLSSSLKDPTHYENRIIFLTDAMPNRGELSKDGLFGLVQNASEKKIYTTFIGVGVDFNTDLVEQVSKIRGANYYSVHSKESFFKRMDEEFDYMVTPILFDLKLSFASKGYEISHVFGSPEANLSTGTLMRVNTLFPSTSTDAGNRGGIILLQLKSLHADPNQKIDLSINYQDQNGSHMQKSTLTPVWQKRENSATAKAIILSDFVSLMHNWMSDMRRNCNDVPPRFANPILLEKEILKPLPDIPGGYLHSPWERKSCKIEVSLGYHKFFSHFDHYFTTQIKPFSDDQFEKEKAVLQKLIETKKNDQTSDRIDDWNTGR